jgi:small nuclear ribonucleoprotein (snRNP)-like protein
MWAWRRTTYRQRVLVTTRTGRTFAGLLWARRGPLLVLVDVSLVGDPAAPVALDGRVVIEIANVDFVQIPRPLAALGGV